MIDSIYRRRRRSTSSLVTSNKYLRNSLFHVGKHKDKLQNSVRVEHKKVKDLFLLLILLISNFFTS